MAVPGAAIHPGYRQKNLIPGTAHAAHQANPTRHCQAESADATGKQVVHWDTDLKGFGVLCSGEATPRLLSFSGSSRQQNPPRDYRENAELSLSEAKDKARKVLLDMRGGADPKQKPSIGTLQENCRPVSAVPSPQCAEQGNTAAVRIHLAP